MTTTSPKAIIEEDKIAQEGQGVIADRTDEHLATSDRGIIILRRRFQQGMRAAMTSPAPAPPPGSATPMAPATPPRPVTLPAPAREPATASVHH
jgi:hypothetical protein